MQPNASTLVNLHSICFSVFWCDADGIKTRHTDGTDQKMLYVPRTPHEKTFRSVGVYEVQSLKLSMDSKSVT